MTSENDLNFIVKSVLNSQDYIEFLCVQVGLQLLKFKQAECVIQVLRR